MKFLILIAVALALAAGLWTQRDSAWSRRLQASMPGSPSSAPATPPAGLRKCLRGTEVLYTNEACPAGSEAQRVNGAVTVVPAAQSGKLPSLPASVPNARELLKANEPTLRDQRMEQAP
jgi:hypothetical protein